jgi:hypothetical protein
MSIEKESAEKILDNLPDKASWDNKMLELGLRKKINETVKTVSEAKLGTLKKLRKKIFQKIFE